MLQIFDEDASVAGNATRKVVSGQVSKIQQFFLTIGGVCDSARCSWLLGQDARPRPVWREDRRLLAVVQVCSSEPHKKCRYRLLRRGSGSGEEDTGQMFLAAQPAASQMHVDNLQNVCLGSRRMNLRCAEVSCRCCWE